MKKLISLLLITSLTLLGCSFSKKDSEIERAFYNFKDDYEQAQKINISEVRLINDNKIKANYNFYTDRKLFSVSMVSGFLNYDISFSESDQQTVVCLNQHCGEDIKNQQILDIVNETDVDTVYGEIQKLSNDMLAYCEEQIEKIQKNSELYDIDSEFDNEKGLTNFVITDTNTDEKEQFSISENGTFTLSSEFGEYDFFKIELNTDEKSSDSPILENSDNTPSNSSDNTKLDLNFFNHNNISNSSFFTQFFKQLLLSEHHNNFLSQLDNKNLSYKLKLDVLSNSTEDNQEVFNSFEKVNGNLVEVCSPNKCYNLKSGNITSTIQKEINQQSPELEKNFINSSKLAVLVAFDSSYDYKSNTLNVDNKQSNIVLKDKSIQFEYQTSDNKQTYKGNLVIK